MHDTVDSNQAGRVWVAPLDVVLSDYDVVQPDILFVSNTRANILTEANIQGAPDLVVEILSPATVHTTGNTSGLFTAATECANTGW